MSKSVFTNGMVINNKKLLINFLKDSIVAKHIVLGETIKPIFFFSHVVKCPWSASLTKYSPCTCITVSNLFQYAVEFLKNTGFQYVNSTTTKTSTKMERQCFI